jgi:hypothetical protein
MRSLINTIRSWVVWIFTHPGLYFFLLIVAMTTVTNRLPEQWTVWARIFNGYIIIALLAFGYFRAERKANLYRADLDAFFTRAEEIMRDRNDDLAAVKDTAMALVRSTASIAEVLKKDTKDHFESVDEKLEAVSKKVTAGAKAAHKAYEEANSVNTKIEDLNKRLLEQDDGKKDEDS